MRIGGTRAERTEWLNPETLIAYSPPGVGHYLDVQVERVSECGRERECECERERVCECAREREGRRPMRTEWLNPETLIAYSPPGVGHYLDVQVFYQSVG